MPPRSKVSPAADRTRPRASAIPPLLSRPPRLRPAAIRVRARCAPAKLRAAVTRPPSMAGPPDSRAIARSVRTTRPPEAVSPGRARDRTVLPPPISKAASAAGVTQSISRARPSPSAELPRRSRRPPASRAHLRRRKARLPLSRTRPPDSKVRAQAAWVKRRLLPLVRARLGPARVRNRRVAHSRARRVEARPPRKAVTLSERRSLVKVGFPRKGLGREPLPDKARLRRALPFSSRRRPDREGRRKARPLSSRR
ncbi:hypothetical protein APR11_001697 [Nocardia amikacinitolerans]|nr:hypothetical protein [Nocardia amikacinitolerans]